MKEMNERARKEAAILGFQKSNTGHDNIANDNTMVQTMRTSTADNLSGNPMTPPLHQEGDLSRSPIHLELTKADGFHSETSPNF
jgi:hypothetical protein